MSFTQKEYRYAVETNKPVIAFLHENPEAIPSGKCEQDPESKQKLLAFREVCRPKMCKAWISATDLGAKVSRSVIHLIKNNPAIGWVRGDAVPDEGIAITINKLREENEALRTQVERIRKEPPRGAEFLSQGHEKFGIGYAYRQIIDNEQVAWTPMTSMTWDEIFAVVGPCMIREGSDFDVQALLRDEIIKRDRVQIQNKYELEIDSGTYHKIMVQLRALGLITPSEQRRSAKDRGTFWSLTPYGEDYLHRLLAIPRSV
jgi:hypothetical protein